MIGGRAASSGSRQIPYWAEYFYYLYIYTYMTKKYFHIAGVLLLNQYKKPYLL